MCKGGMATGQEGGALIEILSSPLSRPTWTWGIRLCACVHACYGPECKNASVELWAYLSILSYAAPCGGLRVGLLFSIELCFKYWYCGFIRSVIFTPRYALYKKGWDHNVMYAYPCICHPWRRLIQFKCEHRACWDLFTIFKRLQCLRLYPVSPIAVFNT